MMNKMMGLLASYLDGFRPSMTPPCSCTGAEEAEAEAEAEATDEAALVATETIEGTLDMAACATGSTEHDAR